MAGQLYDSLAIPVEEAVALNRRINFGGHSLGGSLALLLAVLFRLRLQVPPALLQCCTFGSPPVLSHGKGAGGDGIVQVKRLHQMSATEPSHLLSLFFLALWTTNPRSY